MDLSNKRREYVDDPLNVESVDGSPFKQFERWLGQASAAEMVELNAMILSTVSCTGQPTQRTVLLKHFDENGLVFFTNYQSRKASQIEHNDCVCVLFPWYALQRQVEIAGAAEKVGTAESMKYFALRPRDSQIGAWVSEQSSVVSARGVLQAKFVELKQRFASGDIPRPPSWGGYRIRPDRFEFWQGGQNRLHDRIEYLRDANGSWSNRRLAP